MAEYVEIDIDQGADFLLSLGLRNDDGTLKNASGFTFRSDIKKSFYSQTSVASFTVDSVDAADGVIVLTLSAEETANIKPGRYLFDVKQIDTSNKVERLAEGIVTVNPQVTE